MSDEQSGTGSTESKKKGTRANSRNKQAAVVLNLVHAMQGVHPILPVPSKTFRVVLEHGDRRVVLVAADGVVSEVSSEAVDDAFSDYYYRESKLDPSKVGYVLPNDLANARKIFRSLSAPLSTRDIAPVLQASTKGYCWRRLPFDLKDGPTPVFDGIMTRTTNAKALMAWVGALFHPGKQQTYLWVYGAGRNSKGRLFDLLAKIFGPTYKPESPPKGESRFWTSGLVGKRLVTFQDCNDYRFVQSGLFKSLTGGDLMQRIERKGENSVCVELHAMYAILSNEKPAITGLEADRRRAIFAEMKPIPEGEIKSQADVDKALWEEAPGILWKCIEAYRMGRGKSGDILQDTSEMDDIIRDVEEDFSVFFDDYLVAEEGAEVEASLLKACMMEAGFRRGPDQRDLLKWLTRNVDGLEKVKSRQGARRSRVYRGLRLNDAKQAGFDELAIKK